VLAVVHSGASVNRKKNLSEFREIFCFSGKNEELALKLRTLEMNDILRHLKKGLKYILKKGTQLAQRKPPDFESGGF
jgi:hypothetical protein